MKLLLIQTVGIDCFGNYGSDIIFTGVFNDDSRLNKKIKEICTRDNILYKVIDINVNDIVDIDKLEFNQFIG